MAQCSKHTTCFYAWRWRCSSVAPISWLRLTQIVSRYRYAKPAKVPVHATAWAWVTCGLYRLAHHNGGCKPHLPPAPLLLWDMPRDSCLAAAVTMGPPRTVPGATGRTPPATPLAEVRARGGGATRLQGQQVGAVAWQRQRESMCGIDCAVTPVTGEGCLLTTVPDAYDAMSITDPPAARGTPPVRAPKAPLQLQAAAPGPLRVLQLARDVAPVGTLGLAVGCSPKEPVSPSPRTALSCCPVGMWPPRPPPAPSADLHAAPHVASDPLPLVDEEKPVLCAAPQVAHAQGRAAFAAPTAPAPASLITKQTQLHSKSLLHNQRQQRVRFVAATAAQGRQRCCGGGQAAAHKAWWQVVVPATA